MRCIGLGVSGLRSCFLVPVTQLATALTWTFAVRPLGFEPRTCGLRDGYGRVRAVRSGAMNCGFVQSGVHQGVLRPPRIARIAGWIVGRVHVVQRRASYSGSS
jgi:hypothetical protein